MVRGALAAVAKQRPDLILMDIQLPIMDGYTATRQIKADPALRLFPSSPSLPTRSAAKKRRRGQRAVMTMFRSPSAHVNYWRKSVSTFPKPDIDCCSA